MNLRKDKYLKGIFKKKVKVTVATIVTFFITGHLSYGGITNTVDNTTGDIYFHINNGGKNEGNSVTNAGSILDNAGATGKNSIAAGIGAQATKKNSMAVGNDAKATGKDSVAVGNGSKALGIDTVATGQNARAYGKNSIVMGNDSEALGKNSMAAGENARAHGESSIALGGNSMALGAPEDYKANTRGKFIKVRIENDMIDHYAIYTDEIRDEANKSKDFVYIKKSDGTNAWVDIDAYNDLPYEDRKDNNWYNLNKYRKIEKDGKGYFIKSNYGILDDRYDLTAKNMIAIGEAAVARREGSVALGNRSSAIGEKSLAQGYVSQATGEQSIALGNNARAGLLNSANEYFQDDETGNYYYIQKPGTNGEYTEYIAHGEKIEDDYKVKVKYIDKRGKVRTRWEKYAEAKKNNEDIINYSRRDGDLTVAIGSDSFAIEHGAMAIGQKAFAGSKDIDYVKDDNGNMIEVNGEYTEVYDNKIEQNSKGEWILKRDGLNDLVLQDPSQKDKIGDSQVIIESRDENGKVILAGAEKYAKNQRYSTYDVSRTGGENAVAFGLMSNATNRNAMAMGNYSSALGENSVAVGKGSEALGYRSMAFGTDSLAGHKGAKNMDERFVENETGVYIREVNKFGKVTYKRLDTPEERERYKNEKKYSHKGDSTMAFGYKSEATNYSSVAIGHRAKSSGSKSMAVGNQTLATGNKSGAIGYESSATGNKSYAIGTEAFAGWDGPESELFVENNTGPYVKIGTEYKFVSLEDMDKYKGQPRYSRRGDMSLAFGYRARANSFGSLALGYYSDSTGKKGLAVGNRTEASGDLSTAMGYDSHANGTESIASGFRTRSTGEKSMAFGNNALSGYLVRDYTRDDKGDYVGYKGDYYKLNGNTFNHDGKTLDITKLDGVYRYREVKINQSQKNYFNQNEIGDFVYIGNKTGEDKKTDSSNYVQLIDSFENINGDIVAYDGEEKYMQVKTGEENGKPVYKYVPNNVDGEFVKVGSEYKHLIKSYKDKSGNIQKLQDGKERFFAKADYNLAVGYNAKAANRAASAFGYNAHALGSHSAAIGNMAVSTGKEAIAVGNNSLAEGDYSVVLGNKSFAGFDNVDWIRDNDGEFVEVKSSYYKLEEKNGKLIYKDKNGIEHDYEGSKAGQRRYTAVDVKHLVKNFKEDNNGMFGRLDENGGHNPDDEGKFVALIKGDDGKLYYKDANKDLKLYDGKRYEGKEVGGYTMAMGENASAVSKGSTAIGYNAHALGDHSTAFGNKAISIGVHSLAFGTKTKAVGNSASAIGNYSEAYGDLSLALGDGAYAGGFKEDTNGEYILNNGIYEKYDDSKKYEVGLIDTKRYSKNKNNGQETIAIGSDSMAANVNAISLGTGAHAQGKNSMAYGNHSFAGKSVVDYYRSDDNKGLYGVVDGKYYQIKDGKINGQDYNGIRYSRITIDKKDANNSIALGTEAVATNRSAVAIGYDSTAIGEHSTAIGDGAFAGTKTSYEKSDDGEYYNINIPTNTGWIKKYLNKEEALKVLVEQRGETPEQAEKELSEAPKYIKKYGRDTIAIGYNAHATDEEATAIGIEAKAGGKGSIAFGKGSTVDGVNAIGFGNKSFVNGKNASAYGVQASALGENALAVGTASRVDAQNGIAVGNRASVIERDSIAVGVESKATGIESIAIGNKADAGSYYTKSLASEPGKYIMITGGKYQLKSELKDNDVVYTNGKPAYYKDVKNNLNLDTYDKHNGSDTIAIGYNSKAKKLGAITLGTESKAMGEDSVALGYQAEALGDNSMALGESSKATSEQAFAIGNEAKATAKDTIAFGYMAKASKEEALAIGNEAEANEQKSIAFGNESKTYTISSVAIGDKSKAGMENKGTMTVDSFSKSNRNSTAIGSLADAKGGFATAIGSRTRAYGTYSTAIGEASFTDENAKRSVAIGARATVGLDYYATPAQGAEGYEDRTKPFDRYEDEKEIHGENDIYASVAVGRYAHVTKSSGVALGHKAEVTGENSIAIGRMSEVHDKEDAVALGSYSVVDRDKYNLGYNRVSNDNAEIANDIKKYNEAVAYNKKVDRFNELQEKENKGLTPEEQKEYNDLMNNNYWNKKPLPEISDKLKGLVKNGDAFVSTSGAISVGNKEKGILRQITNLAAGSEDTDAVNVAQLKSANVNLTANGGTKAGDNVYSDATQNILLKKTVNSDGTGSVYDLKLGNRVILGETDTNKIDINGNDGTIRIGATVNNQKESTGGIYIDGINGNIYNAGKGSIVKNENAIALGNQTQAGFGEISNGVITGVNTLAFGDQTKALVDRATAFGLETQAGIVETINGRILARGKNSLAFGEKTKAFGNNSVAFGLGTLADKYNSVAFGEYTNAQGRGAIAFGLGEENNDKIGALGDYSTVWGNKSTAFGNYSTAFGENNIAKDLNSTAFGMDNKALSTASLAFGKGNIAGIDSREDVALDDGTKLDKGLGALAFGMENKADLALSTAFGHKNTAHGQKSLAFGESTNAIGAESTTFGYKTKAEGVRGTAFGDSASTGNKENATAFGQFSRAEGLNSTAFGYGTYAGGTYSLAFGQGKNTKDENDNVTIDRTVGALGALSVTFGEENTASGIESLAFGRKTKAEGERGTAFGDSTLASGINSTAFGAFSQALSTDSLAFGNKTTAGTTVREGLNDPGRGAVAFGLRTKASSKYSLAFGKATNAKGYGSVAFGEGRIENADNNTIDEKIGALGDFSTVWGGVSTASGKYSTAFGQNSQAKGESSLAFGVNSVASADNSLAALGGFVGENAKGSAAIGIEAEALNENSYAIGNRSKAKHDGAVALGAGSVTKDATQVSSYTFKGITTDGTFAGNNPTSVISVGAVGKERQIVNVAAGQISKDSTDAINGSQLFATNNVIGNVADSMKKVLGGNSNLEQNGNFTMSDIGGTGKNTIDEAIKENKNNIAGNTSNITNLGDRVSTNETNIAKKIDKDSIHKIIGKGLAKVDNDGDITKGNVTVTVDAKSVQAEAKKAVKVVKGTNTTVTEGTEGDNGEVKTYAVNVSDDAIIKASENTFAKKDASNIEGENAKKWSKKLGTGSATANKEMLVTGNTLAKETRVKAGSYNTISADESAADNLIALDDKVGTNATNIEGNKKEISNVKNIAEGKLSSFTVTANDTKGSYTVDKDHDTFNLKDGNNIEITMQGKNITIGTSKNVNFETVTVGGTNGISLKEKEISGLKNTEFKDNETGKDTRANIAATEGQLSALNKKITNVSNQAVKISKGDNILITDGTDGNKVISTAKDVSFDKVTVGNVVTDKTNNTITGLSNTTWGEGHTVLANRAATEGQLQKAETGLNTKITNLGDTVNNNTTAIDNVKKSTFGLKDDKDATTTANLNKQIKIKGDGTNISTAVDGSDLKISLNNTLSFNNGNSGNLTINTDGKGTIDGLTNTDWGTGHTVNENRAATEKQLATSESSLQTSIDNVKKIADSKMAGWELKANDETDGHKVNKDSKDDDVIFAQGDNISVTRDKNKITIGTNKEVKFDKVNVGDKISLSKDGNVNANKFIAGNIKVDGAKDKFVEGKDSRYPTVEITNEAGEKVKGHYEPSETANTISGLGNTTWDKSKAVDNRAATEGQLKDLQTAGFGLIDGNNKEIVKSLGGKIKLTGDTNITTTADKDSSTINFTLNENLTGLKTASFGNININGNINIVSGLANTTLDNGFGEGNRISQAATEGQLKIVNHAANKHNTVSAGTNVMIAAMDIAETGGINYQVNVDNMRVTNAKVKDKGNGSQNLELEFGDGTKKEFTGFSDKYIASGEYVKGGVQVDGKAVDSIRLHRNDNTNIDIAVTDLIGEDGVINKTFVTKEDLANKYIGFKGDNTDVEIQKHLNKTLHIKGGVKSENGEKLSKILTDNNIGVIADDNNGLTVKLAKKLSGLEEIKLGDNTTITDGNISVGNDKDNKININAPLQEWKNGKLENVATSKGGVITGLANKTWTNDTKPVSGRAATEDQLAIVSKAANNHSTVTVDKNSQVTDGNILLTKTETKDDKGVNYDLKLNDKLTLGSSASNIVLDGTNATAKIGDISFKTKQPTSGGSTGNNGIISGLRNTTSVKNFRDDYNEGRELNPEVQGEAATVALVHDLWYQGFGLSDKDGKIARDVVGGSVKVLGDGKNISTAVKTVGKDSHLEISMSDTPLFSSVNIGTKDSSIALDGTTREVKNLSNTSWDGTNIISGRAATEDQLKSLNNIVTTNENKITDYQLIANPEIGKTGYAVDSNGNVTLKVQDSRNEKNIKDVKIEGIASTEKLKELADKPLQFNTDNGYSSKKLGEVLTIQGGADKNSLIDNNIGVVAEKVTGADGKEDYQLKVKLSKKLSGLEEVKIGDKTTITSGDISVGTTNKVSITDGNIKVGDNTSLTKDTLKLAENVYVNNDGSAKFGKTNINTDGTITGLTNTTWDGTATSGRAATEDQLKLVDDKIGTTNTETINKGFALRTSDKDKATQILGGSILVEGSNNITAKASGDKENSKLEISMNNDITLNSVKTGNTTMNDSGITVSDGTDSTTYAKDGMKVSNGPSVTKVGIDAGSKKITNVLAGDNDLDAVNFSQLKAVKKIAAEHATIAGDDNITVETKDHNYTVKLNNDITLGDKNSKNVKINGLTGTIEATDGIKVGETLINSTGVVLGKNNENISFTKEKLSLGNNVYVKNDGSAKFGTTVVNKNGTITGLTNTEYAKGTTGVNGRESYAATEGQLQQAIKTINTDITNVSQGTFGLFDGKDSVTNTLGQTVKVAGDGNIIAKADTTNNKFVISLNDEIAFGKAGTDGKAGKDGTDGKAGKDGKVTINGADGKSSVAINGKDGISIKGKDGASGVTIKGVDGKDGTTNGVIGIDGHDGVDGINGKIVHADIKVMNGQNGIDGTDGNKGKDGMTRIVYEDSNNVKHEVATMDDGLKFAGNTGVEAKNKLGSKVTIKGTGNKADDKYSSENVKTKVSQDKDGNTEIKVMLDKDLTANSVTVGKAGENGKLGEDGKITVNGADGKSSVAINGKDGSIGLSGKDGKSSVAINGTDGVTIKGEDGSIGLSGKDGIFIKGKDGKDGVTIKSNDGIGVIGLNGKDGISANISIAKDGTDGMTRIVYEDSNKVKHEVATMKDGLKFVGDDGKEISKELNSTLNIIGGVQTIYELDEDGNIKTSTDGSQIVKKSIESQLTDKNIGVVKNESGELEIKLVKDLTGLNSADFGNITIDGGKSKISFINNGGEISGLKDLTDISNGDMAANKNYVDKKVEKTDKDIKDLSDLAVKYDSTKKDKISLGNENNKTTISNVKSSIDDKLAGQKDKTFLDKLEEANKNDGNDAVNVSDLQKTVSALDKNLTDKGLQFAGNDENNVVTNKLGSKVTIKGRGAKADDKYSSQNVKTKISKDKDGNTSIEVMLDKELALDKVTVGKDGKTGVTIDGENGVGVIGLNGKDGISAKVSIAKDGITRIVYKDANDKNHSVATLDDGLKFKGDNDTVIIKSLNSQLDILGGADKDSLSDKNIGVVSDNGNLNIKLSKNLKGLEDIKFGVNGNDTITINGKDSKISFNTTTTPDGKTKNGTGVISGLKDLDDKSTPDMAVNKKYVDKEIEDVKNGGFNLNKIVGKGGIFVAGDGDLRTGNVEISVNYDTKTLETINLDNMGNKVKQDTDDKWYQIDKDGNLDKSKEVDPKNVQNKIAVKTTEFVPVDKNDTSKGIQAKDKDKDSFVTADKVANAINGQEIVYKANGGTEAKDKKSVKLSEGLDFVNGDNLTAEIQDKGVVKYNLNKELKGLEKVKFGEEGKETITIDGVGSNSQGPSIHFANKTVTDKDGNKKINGGRITGLQDLDDNSSGDMAVNKNYVDNMADRLGDKLSGATLKYKAKDNESTDKTPVNKEVSINLATDEIFFEETDNITIDISKDKGLKQGNIKFSLNPNLTGLQTATFGNSSGNNTIIINGGESKISFVPTTNADGSTTNNGVISGLKDAVNKDEAVNLGQLKSEIAGKADKTYVDTELNKKADKTYVDSVNSKVDQNTTNITNNTNKIDKVQADVNNKLNVNGDNINGNQDEFGKNVGTDKISSDTSTKLVQEKAVKNYVDNAVKSSGEVSNKANKDASNLSDDDKTKWQEKLGDGEIKKGDKGLVTGDTVYNYYEAQAELDQSQNQAIENNSKKIGHLNDEIAHVGSLSAAMAGLHTMQYDPLNPSQVMAAVGNYKNKSAVAVGLTHYVNEKFMVTGAVSVGQETKLNSMMSLGFTYKFGDKEERERRHLPKEYDGKQMASIYMMQTEMYKQRLKNQSQAIKMREMEQKMSVDNQKEKIKNKKLEKKVEALTQRLERMERLLKRLEK